MRKLKIRFIVGFPLGVFVGYSVLLFYNIIIGKNLLYFESFNLSSILIMNTMVQYFLFGIIGMLSITICTMFEDDEGSIIKQISMHTIITLINELLICFIGNIINNNRIALVLFFLILLIVLGICNFVAFKRANDFVSTLNHQLTCVKSYKREKRKNK